MLQTTLRFWPVFLLLNTLFFNEYLIYILKIGFTCEWPCAENGRCLHDALRVFMIADTHLLGDFRGHWYDKLRREWQMYRAYQTSLRLGPDAIFFLGDLMDEGMWTDNKRFNKYADRFYSLFGTGKDGPKTHAVAGNHDLGFHYEIDPAVVGWFEDRFNRSMVDSVVIKGQPFVLINSMALHEDGCRLCSKAESQLNSLSSLLSCAKNQSCHDTSANQFRPYRSPILLQHFPLFRKNEDECVRDDDFDYSAENRDEKYRPKWDSLSETASRTILRKLEPRAAFNGHAHRDCRKKWSHPVSMWEYTVNSFSWRNGDKPTFLMVTITDEEILVGTCRLPQESTVICIYVVVAVIIVVYILYLVFTYIRSRFSPRSHASRQYTQKLD